mgnify:CR=1 FL=1
MKSFITIYDQGMKMIRFDHIFILESSKEYVNIVCFYLNRKHLFSQLKTIKSYQSLLPENFIRISRFQIININKSELIDNNRIFFENGVETEIKGRSGLRYVYQHLSEGTQKIKIG